MPVLHSSRRSISTAIRALAVAFAVLALGFAPVRAQQATPIAGGNVARAAAWLQSQQADNGGFVGFSGDPDAGTTVDAVIALAAARNAGAMVDLNTALTFLEANALVYAQTGPGQAAKLVLALVAAGQNPRDIGNVDPVAICEQAATHEGVYGGGVYDHALILLALQAAGAEIPDGAIAALRATQNDDGSWAFDGSTGTGSGDTNTTAIVTQALVATGHANDIMVLQAVRYFRGAQTASGAFPYQPAADAIPDANSTAIVLQALLAAGEDVTSADWRDVPAAFESFQNASGAFRYQDDPPDDNLFATLQALPAIAGQAFPIQPMVVTPAASPVA